MGTIFLVSGLFYTKMLGSTTRRQSAHLQQQHQSRSTAFDLQQPNPLQSPRPLQQVKRPPWVNERCNMFGRRSKKSKKVKLSMWEHEFVCMANSGQATPPSPMEKAELIRPGLGPRKMSMVIVENFMIALFQLFQS